MWDLNILQSPPTLFHYQKHAYNDIGTRLQSIIFSFDNRYLIVANRSGYIKTFDLNNPSQAYKETLSLAHKGGVISLISSPNNQYIAYKFQNFPEEEKISKFGFINLDTGAIASIAVPSVEAIAFSNDGNLLALSTTSIGYRIRMDRKQDVENKIFIFDVSKYSEKNTQLPGIALPYIKDVKTPVNALIFSPDNRYLVGGVLKTPDDKEKKLAVWDLQKPYQEPVVITFKDNYYNYNVGPLIIEQLAFSPDGKYLALIPNGGTIKIVDFEDQLDKAKLKIDETIHIV